jgi:hypothetical protein
MYHNTVPPEHLTINEMPDSAHGLKVLAHYQGVNHEFKTGEVHVCDLCRPYQLNVFFKRFDNMQEEDVQDVQEFEHRLQVTEDEWNLHQQIKDREEIKF